jgi:hypothetical protein
MASGNSSGTVVRLVVLLIVLGVAAGGFFYMRNRPPSLASIQATIDSGVFYEGVGRERADEIFGQEPTKVPAEYNDSPSQERWLYSVRANPTAYFLVHVQAGRITQVQRADAQGKAMRPEDIPR